MGYVAGPAKLDFRQDDRDAWEPSTSEDLCVWYPLQPTYVYRLWGFTPISTAEILLPGCSLWSRVRRRCSETWLSRSRHPNLVNSLPKGAVPTPSPTRFGKPAEVSTQGIGLGANKRET